MATGDDIQMRAPLFHWCGAEPAVSNDAHEPSQILILASLGIKDSIQNIVFTHEDGARMITDVLTVMSKQGCNWARDVLGSIADTKHGSVSCSAGGDRAAGGFTMEVFDEDADQQEEEEKDS